MGNKCFYLFIIIFNIIIIFFVYNNLLFVYLFIYLLGYYNFFSTFSLVSNRSLTSFSIVLRLLWPSTCCFLNSHDNTRMCKYLQTHPLMFQSFWNSSLIAKKEWCDESYEVRLTYHPCTRVWWSLVPYKYVVTVGCNMLRGVLDPLQFAFVGKTQKRL